MNTPYMINFDGSGNLFICDNANNRVRKINTATGVISLVAGGGTTGTGGDGSAATAAGVQFGVGGTGPGLAGVAVDASGNIYISDGTNNKIRKVDGATGIISTYAGTGTAGALGDGGSCATAQLNQPRGLVIDGSGNLFIADATNNKVRKIVLSTGIITTVAGTGTAGATGDEAAATAALLSSPRGVCVDAAGNIYIADRQNNKIRMVTASTGFISTYAGNGTGGFAGDGGAAATCQINRPSDVKIDAVGNLFIADNSNTRVRMVNASGIITTVAGTGGFGGAAGDGGPATAAAVRVAPISITLIDANHYFISDQTNNRIRYVKPNSKPYFSGGSPLGITVCENSIGDSLNALLAVRDSDIQQTLTWSVFTTPLNGTLGGANTAASNAGLVTPVGLYYTPNTGYIGLDSFKMKIKDGYDSSIVSVIVTVNGVPTVLPITGTTNVCVAGNITLSDATAGGTWTATNANAIVAAGVVTGVSGGRDTIKYAVTNACGTTTVSYPITVNTVPATPPAISGPSSVCTGFGISLTDATSGGVWSSSASGIASVGSLSGSISGVVTGVANITYTVTNACGSSFVLAPVTVNTTPGAISGSAVSCVGASNTLTDLPGGGTWTSTATTIATVGSSSGSVTGVAIGTTTISYTLGTGCFATLVVTVNAPPGTITGTTSVCVGANTTLIDAGGGTWTSGSTAIATIGSLTGVVTGLAPGTSLITYAIGSCTISTTVSVNALPATITPAGAVAVCIGATATFADASPGGTWSSGTPAVASVGTGGIVTGLLAGTSAISYTSAAGCSSTKTITVNITPAAISPSSATVCTGNTVTLTESVGGGIWSSSAPGVASVTGGIITGVTVGTASILYTIGSCFATAAITVNLSPNAGTIVGPTTVCVGLPVTLTDAAPGGVWSSSNTAVAAVGSTGIVSGVSVGAALISYSVTNGCGTALATATITTGLPASPGSISGVAMICAGTYTMMTDAVSGGVWSVTNSSASILTTGLVTGIVPGIDTVLYTVTNTCGSVSTMHIINIGAYLTAGTITGLGTVCAGSNITLTDLAPGGVWSSSSIAIATVVGGIVHGVSGGTATISYTVSSACGSASATKVVSVTPTPNAGSIVGPASICAGNVITYTNAVSGGTWSLSNTIIATINSFGMLTAITPGVDTIKYTFTNACGTAVATKVITIGAFLTAGAISGPSSVCAGSAITLTDPATGGVWSSSNAHATNIGGVVTGVSAGVDTILYTVTAACGSAVATHPVTVNALPNAGSITGPSTICIGTPVTFTDASSGGVWSLTNAHATVILGGVVTPVSAGTDTLKYTVTNGCGTASTTLILTIGTSVSAGAISGPGLVCIGSAITLTDGVAGGVWSASNSNATVTGAGVVTGVATGIDTIKYTVTNSCGTAFATATVNVSPAPNAGSITGTSIICMGTLTTYSDAATGGVWLLSNAHATVTGGGVVTAVSAGTDTLSYTVTNGCGTATATLVLTIGSTVSAGTISGPGAVCIGSAITLTDGAGGGVWSSSNSHATVTGAGVVTGVTSGTDTIRYTVTNSCGTAIATATVTVSAAPVAGTIVGPATQCVGGFTIYTDAAPGGIWSVTNGSATITSLGVLTAVSTGTDTIVYTVTNGCGSAVATKVVTISGAITAGTISGPSSICIGTPITLTDGVAGGVWSQSNAHAVINILGVVTGLTVGTDTISYTVTNSCGTAVATYIVTIGSSTGAGIISGPSAVCVGSLITMTETVGGGAWSSSNTNATITTGGVVTGITPGIDTISYTITNACGIVSTTKIISVDMLAGAGSITGAGGVCVGSSITLTDGAGGGVWSSSNTSASVTGAGIVTGLAAGIDTISYTVTNSCGSAVATHIVNVNSATGAGVISGPSVVCVSSLITLTETVGGGAWSSSNTNATITTGGVVTGITPGTDTISYTITNACGIVSTTKVITISTTPFTGPVSGPTVVCIASGIILTDPTPGGTWSSSNANATVGSLSGLVTGVATGTDVITYTVTNSCGTATATSNITISPLPFAGTITGPDTVCAGSAITLTDGVPGGLWSSGNPNATVSGPGVVTGISAGTAPISYTVTNSCGTVSAVKIVTVLDRLTSGLITGPSSVCIGSGITLTDPVPGGVWLSSNSTAIIVGPGIVDGVSIGIDTISYSVSGYCGSSVSTKVISVNPLPFAAPITGPSSQGVGTSVTLSDAVPGGVWTSSTTSVATISVGAGVVYGVSAGVTTITYTVTNSFGCPASVTAPHTVLLTGMPVTLIPTNVCAGSNVTLVSSGPSGSWSSNNTDIARVSEFGVVTGVNAGSAEVIYTVQSGGVTNMSVFKIVVIPMPQAGTITGNTEVLVGATIDLADGISGGIWSSSNTAIAAVSGGAVTTVAEGRADIIYTVTNECGIATAIHAIRVSAPVGTIVNNVTEGVVELKVFPNPNNGVFTLELQSGKEEPIVIMITDVKGRIVKEITSETNNSMNIKLDEAAGIYILNVTAGNRKYIQKVIIE